MQILGYWMQQIQETTEFQQIAQAEQLDVDLLHKEINNLPNEIIVKTATDSGLSKWETVLDIPTTRDLDIRRFNILLKLNNKVNLTYRWLENKLQLAVGKSCYQIDLDHNKYTLRVSVTADKENILINLRKELRKLIPANLGLETSTLEHEECGVYSGVIVRTRDIIIIGE
ncbi:MAG: DUF2313 domain-containing protein [Clostridium lundense]|nr:DUF2313 domain-containing protein [Clostridium lundense]